MKNLYNTSEELLGTSMENVQNRLDALAMVLKTCTGQTCQKPWSALHPKDTVSTIVEAVHPDFNEFYAAQPKVKFEDCLAGYFLDNERPTIHDVFGSLTQQSMSNVDAWAEYWMVAG
jgi:N-acetylglucosamine-6-sulfatase